MAGRDAKMASERARRPLTRLLACTASLCIVLSSASVAKDQPRTRRPCALGSADAAWLKRALSNWQWAEARILRLPPSRLPEIVAVDAVCQANAMPKPDQPIRWRARRHNGKVSLPDGHAAPVGVMSFAAPGGADAASGFFVMSMPTVWRKAGVTSELGLETLMEGVLLHEMTHTRQFPAVNRALQDVTRRYNLPDDINDDSIQARFGGDPAYVRGWQAETDLLYAAAAAPTDAQSRQLAGEALAAMRARRSRWYVGADEQWRDLDDIFLQMEGLGQWVIYKFYVDGRRRIYAPAVALQAVRRGRKQWSQEEGLGLMLVVDRLVPDWRRRVFSERPTYADALLEAAATSSGK